MKPPKLTEREQAIVIHCQHWARNKAVANFYKTLGLETWELKRIIAKLANGLALLLMLSNVQAEENTDLRATLVSPLKSEAIQKLEKELIAMYRDKANFSFARTPPDMGPDYAWVSYNGGPWIRFKVHSSYEERLEFARKWTSPEVFAAMMEGKVLK